MELYCIECEKMVWADLGVSGYTHQTNVWAWSIQPIQDYMVDVHRLFAYCPPPEIEDGWYGTGWQDNLVEPDLEELQMMDKAAESLKLEFIHG